MKATASRNQESEKALMSPIASKLAESMLTVMQLFGIQKFETKKLKSADYERIVTDITPFEGIPEEVKACGYLIKDALAAILASAGIVGLDITTEEGDLKTLTDNYVALVENFKNPQPNGASDTAAQTAPATEAVPSPVATSAPANANEGFIDVGDIKIPDTPAIA